MLRRCVLLMLLLAPCMGLAQETVFYKCTDAKGAVSMQNGTPCAPGMKQEIRRVGEVRTVPVPAKKPQADAPPPAPVYGDFVMVSGPNMKRKPAPESAELPAPPPLFQCRTWDGDDYLGEKEMPPPRCVPLQVVGIDGSQALGMGSACEMRDDTCTAIPDDGLCDAWLRRLDDAEFKLKYAGNDNRGERQAAFDGIDAKVKASRCSPVAPAADPATTTPAPTP
ncbi:hypothetical protein [Thermomonas sp.]|uniref:hypothetical protein n=1 Tax=Thermomonas sp. TaxID=1971895 RepID=UPI002486E5C5|nr:hypothetical protein [Thermomonas sp.]MDI1252172.1 hypothetical protein [Thermomonas sp.]